MNEDMNKLINYMNTDQDVHEDFKKFETKVDKVMKILEDMNCSDTDVQAAALKKADSLNVEDELGDEASFIVNVKEDRTVINKNATAAEPSPTEGAAEMDKFSFMQQVEQDANKRAKMRAENERIAQNFRRVGNDAFRTGEFERAITMYNTAINHVKDSPILYNNRALSYIKVKLYRRAVVDCDYVINKLDEKNLRAYLYRATAYFKLHDDEGFESSIKFAKKHNSKEIEYIDDFIIKIKNSVI